MATSRLVCAGAAVAWLSLLLAPLVASQSLYDEDGPVTNVLGEDSFRELVEETTIPWVRLVLLRVTSTMCGGSGYQESACGCLTRAPPHPLPHFLLLHTDRQVLYPKVCKAAAAAALKLGQRVRSAADECRCCLLLPS